MLPKRKSSLTALGSSKDGNVKPSLPVYLMPQAEVKPVPREDLMGAAEQRPEQVPGKKLRICTEAEGW